MTTKHYIALNAAIFHYPAAGPPQSLMDWTDEPFTM